MTTEIDTPSDTRFAPAERATPDDLRRQSRSIAANGFAASLADAVPEPLVVLNHQRQIVFANRALLDLLGGSPLSEIIGLRPGEALDCQHARRADGGCGTTEFCRTCGAVVSILTSQGGRQSAEECRIFQTGTGEALDLRTHATPLRWEGETYSVLFVQDISDEKRREVLERIFFHDVLNTAGGVVGLAEVLREAEDDELQEYEEMIYRLALQLVEEIESHRDLSAAERQGLEVSPTTLESRAFLREIAAAYAAHESAADVSITVDTTTESVVFSTDPLLLRRVLGNMVKNAVEASGPSDTVAVHARRLDDRVVFSVHNPVVMAPDDQLQVFQRSFSTKGRGRGLGTYSMKLLGERYLEGEVSFTSASGAGTTFRISLPVHYRPSRPGDSPSPHPPYPPRQRGPG